MNKNYVYIFLIILLGLICYINSLGNSFIWDDLILIVENPNIKHLSNIAKIFTSALAPDPFSNNPLTIFYRPIQTLTYIFDYALFRLNPLGYHLSNILFHIICSILIYGLINLITKDKLISLITASLFVVHPVHAEAVTYISGRADILAAIFFILTLIAYIKYVSSTKYKFFYLLVSALTYLISLLSKEVVLVLPVIIILYNFCFLPKNKLFNRPLFIYLAITVTYVIISFFLFKAHQTHLVSYKSSFAFRTITAIKAVFLYLGLLVFPQNLHMERISPIINSPWELSALVYLFTFLVLLIFMVRLYKYSKLSFFAGLWFLVNLFPVSGVLLRLNAVMAEHWLYIPSIGYFLLFALFFRTLQKNKILTKNILIFLIFGIVLFYSLTTIRQNRVWAQPLSFYERVIRYSSESSKAYFNLGIIYQERGDYPKTLDFIKKAINLNPQEAKFHNNLGLVYLENGDSPSAINEFKVAIRINPDNAEAYLNLGNALAKSGLYKEAVIQYQKSLKLKPDLDKAYFNLGVVYYQQGQVDKAIEEWQRTLEINPQHPGAKNNLENLKNKPEKNT